MKYQQSILFALCFSLLLWNCGGDSNDQNNAPEDEDQVSMNSNNGNSDTDENPTDLAGAMKQMQKTMENLNNGEEVELVDFRVLKERLPEKLIGMDRKSHSGQKAGYASFKVSTAEAKYQDGDKVLDITIMDSGNIGLASMGMAWSMVEIDREDDNGYERTTTIDGFKGYEKYDSKRKSGQLSVFHNNRILVNIEGRNLEPDDLEEAWEELDMDDLDI